jgi:SAM-dependent methyltransferase
MTKLLRLLREHGLWVTLAVVISVIEDLYVRVFDRLHRVQTSGYISLSQTSLNPCQAAMGHRYRGVNAWALKRALRTLAPGKDHRFVDLGCGLGRACLIASAYGFKRVRGVDMVPEFCAQARANAEVFCRGSSGRTPIEILHGDAVEYSRHSDDDVVFLFNPFPVEVLSRVMTNLADCVRQRHAAKLVIYTQRVLETSRTLERLKQIESLVPQSEHTSWGQLFYVFELRPA